MSSTTAMNESPRTPRLPLKDKRKWSISQSQTSVVEKHTERRKRSTALIEEQMFLIKDTQNAIEKILKEIERNSGSGVDKREEELQALLSKSQELLVMLQVMMKIRNELAYARIDLEKAVRADRGIEIAKKRVKWLQKRLEKVISTTRSYCALNLSAPPRCLEKSDVSEKMWNLLTDDQQERYFTQKDDHHGYHKDSVNLMNEFSKMVLKRNPSDILVNQDQAQSHARNAELDEQENRRDKHRTKQLSESKKKKKIKKKTDSVQDESRKDSHHVAALPEGDLYEGQGDSSPEPMSDSELDYGTTESIVSSVGPLHGTRSRLATQSNLSLVQTPTVGSSADTQAYDSEQDQEYWDLDHHKFEWCDYMLKLDPRSWHALGIAVQESFIPKEKHKFDASIPWKEKPMKVNSVIDVHKIALDKLLLRLHRIYEAVGQVTQATIDPLPKDEKMETVMSKQEDVATPWEGTPATTQPATSDTATPASRDTVLPPLAEVPPKSLTLISMSPELKMGSRKSDKFFPRDSNEWCDDIKSGKDIPQLFTFKPPPIHKKTSNVQSRYLGCKSEVQKQKSFTLFRKGEWKPTVVKRLIGAMRAFDSSETPEKMEMFKVEKDTPRWRRVMELLGPSGLKSSNQTIAMEAAKSIGQLNCRHPDVLTALSETICDPSKQPRVLYEASKALILLGTWSPEAMKVIIEHIKKGNELVVKELLFTMTKAKNIPFVNKTTPEFRMLVYLLIELVKVDHHPLSFRACISLGRLCVVEPISKVYLVGKLSTLTAEEQLEALLVLIKQMNCKDKYVLEVLLDHLCTAHNWKSRLEAAELLIFIGSRDLFKILTLEKVFDVLERLLWDHSNKELRAKIAKVINVLGLRQAASSLILRRLEDPNEEVRARAVVSMATLGMKGMKEMKALLDILELDSSVYVRIQVIRAFSHLKWNDPRIIRSLRERERGESILASEARKAITMLLEEER